jgi:hypothetical protein
VVCAAAATGRPGPATLGAEGTGTQRVPVPITVVGTVPAGQSLRIYVWPAATSARFESRSVPSGPACWLAASAMAAHVSS